MSTVSTEEAPYFSETFPNGRGSTLEFRVCDATKSFNPALFELESQTE